MGLEEKRKLKEIQEGPLKDALSKIQEIVGVAIPIEIDLASFTDVPSLEGLQYSGLSSLVQTIEEIGKDDLGKEALKESLKKVIFKNVPNNGSNSVIFDGGVLTNTSTWGGGSYAGYGDMSSALSAKL